MIITLFIGAAVIVEQKTSPFKVKEQVIYGISMAVLIAILELIKVPNPIIIGLLLGNIGYFVFRNWKK